MLLLCWLRRGPILNQSALTNSNQLVLLIVTDSRACLVAHSCAIGGVARLLLCPASVVLDPLPRTSPLLIPLLSRRLQRAYRSFRGLLPQRRSRQILWRTDLTMAILSLTYQHDTQYEGTRDGIPIYDGSAITFHD